MNVGWQEIARDTSEKNKEYAKTERRRRQSEAQEMHINVRNRRKSFILISPGSFWGLALSRALGSRKFFTSANINQGIMVKNINSHQLLPLVAKAKQFIEMQI